MHVFAVSWPSSSSFVVLRAMACDPLESGLPPRRRARRQHLKPGSTTSIPARSYPHSFLRRSLRHLHATTRPLEPRRLRRPHISFQRTLPGASESTLKLGTPVYLRSQARLRATGSTEECASSNTARHPSLPERHSGADARRTRILRRPGRMNKGTGKQVQVSVVGL
uniref:Uncharacterized protein n=1 Tax=Mycena chlorophos TaxID=658473 RepID=A0ABQ0L8L5_MYCCL|nr:predicted protein [Mycena chlorophos]